MQVSINNKKVDVPEGKTVLEALVLSKASVLDSELGEFKKFIFNEACPLFGLIEIDGELSTLPFFSKMPVKDQMSIVTDSDKIKEKIKERSSLLKIKHECYFMNIWQQMLLAEAESSGYVTMEQWKQFSFEDRFVVPSIVHDPNKCIRCQSCIDTCQNIQNVGALSFDEEKGVILDENKCVRCGQCILHCPMNAIEKFDVIIDMLGCQQCAFAKPLGSLKEVDNTFDVLNLLKNNDNYCIVQFAPSIRSSIGEEFGLPDGELVTKKLYAALRRIGFKKVWDTNFAADLTIMEEGTEFIKRGKEGGTLPLITSCSPGWVRFVENFFPDMIPNLSTAKSPQQMFGAVAKTFGAKSLGVDPQKIKVISIMPCTAKKSECNREEMNDASIYWDKQVNYQDVDIVLTTRELARLLKIHGIDLKSMPEEEADSLLGSYTGAAPIFGRTGGVMEAALRTVVAVLTGSPLQKLEFKDLASMDGIKRAELKVGDLLVKVAVAHGLSNAKKVCESILSGAEFAKYHFIEVMACPGGCIGGGGQPFPTNKYTKVSRTDSLNKDDKDVCTLRMSHENPEIKAIYESFLGEPLSDISHKLLHTHYTNRK